MKQPSVYQKMWVLGAVDTVAGRTRDERMRAVAALTFLDEDGNSRRFTWRTIQTWFYRYKNHGIAGMTPQPRKDKGYTRKVSPEELLDAINAARPHFRNLRANKRPVYRFCVETGMLQPEPHCGADPLLCLVLGVPATGKSIIKQALHRLFKNRHVVATVA